MNDMIRPPFRSSPGTIGIGSAPPAYSRPVLPVVVDVAAEAEEVRVDAGIAAAQAPAVE